MRDRDRPRRRVLGALATGLCAIAGCSTTDATGRTTSSQPCAAGFAVVDRQARIERGTRPAVDLTVRNDGEASVTYEVVVDFIQLTSTGLPTRSGRDVLTGTLAPGETVTRTATDDGPEIEQTSDYELTVSVAC